VYKFNLAALGVGHNLPAIATNQLAGAFTETSSKLLNTPGTYKVAAQPLDGVNVGCLTQIATNPITDEGFGLITGHERFADSFIFGMTAADLDAVKSRKLLTTEWGSVKGFMGIAAGDTT